MRPGASNRGKRGGGYGCFCALTKRLRCKQKTIRQKKNLAQTKKEAGQNGKD
jgi:hypothetical protein